MLKISCTKCERFIRDLFIFFFSQIQVLNKIVGEYLQIDLLNLTEVTAIATQVKKSNCKCLFILLKNWLEE